MCSSLWFGLPCSQQGSCEWTGMWAEVTCHFQLGPLIYPSAVAVEILQVVQLQDGRNFTTQVPDHGEQDPGPTLWVRDKILLWQGPEVLNKFAREAILTASKAWGHDENDGSLQVGRIFYKTTSSSSVKLPLMLNQMTQSSAGHWGEPLNIKI